MRNDSEDMYRCGEMSLDDVCLADSDELWMLNYLYKTGGKRCVEIVLNRYLTFCQEDW